jgi:hypothetical protein
MDGCQGVSWGCSAKTINVEGLSEPIVRSLAIMVQAVREKIGNTEKPR